MRHRNKISYLGRKASHRKALLMNLAKSLIAHKRITTTLAKAKALRSYIEPLLTRAKRDTTHDRRMVFSYLQDKEPLKELFNTIAEKIADRPGGYTRILRLPNRIGDNAAVAMIELVDFNTLYSKKKKQVKATRRGGKKKIETTAAKETTTALASSEVASSV